MEEVGLHEVFGWIQVKFHHPLSLCVIEFTATATSSPLLLLGMVIRIN